MRILVLGAAAGGGFPQWNAASEACQRARRGEPAARKASQASIAVSADGERWTLVNASPDLRSQIEATPALQPKQAPRSSPISAVILTNADVDAMAGLLTLREGTPFAIYAHSAVLAVLDANPVFEVVNREIVPRRPLPVGAREWPADVAGLPLAYELLIRAVPGKPPLFLEDGMEELVTDAESGFALGLEFRRDGRRLVYLANCAAVTDAIREWVAGADILFMDGTLWADDELVRAGISAKTGRRMGHVSMSGPEGAMERLAGLQIGRRIFIHMNNSNPALLADSPERAALTRAGWEVAWDGMELEL
jgi:pyrroloquinoline quinone biosynthesis protein B